MTVCFDSCQWCCPFTEVKVWIYCQYLLFQSEKILEVLPYIHGHVHTWKQCLISMFDCISDALAPALQFSKNGFEVVGVPHVLHRKKLYSVVKESVIWVSGDYWKKDWRLLAVWYPSLKTGNHWLNPLLISFVQAFILTKHLWRWRLKKSSEKHCPFLLLSVYHGSLKYHEGIWEFAEMRSLLQCHDIMCLCKGLGEKGPLESGICCRTLRFPNSSTNCCSWNFRTENMNI